MLGVAGTSACGMPAYRRACSQLSSSGAAGPGRQCTTGATSSMQPCKPGGSSCSCRPSSVTRYDWCEPLQQHELACKEMLVSISAEAGMVDEQCCDSLSNRSVALLTVVCGECLHSTLPLPAVADQAEVGSNLLFVSCKEIQQPHGGHMCAGAARTPAWCAVRRSPCPDDVAAVYQQAAPGPHSQAQPWRHAGFYTYAQGSTHEAAGGGVPSMSNLAPITS